MSTSLGDYLEKAIDERLDAIKTSYSGHITGTVDIQKQKIEAEFEKIQVEITKTADGIKENMAELEREIKSKTEAVIAHINTEKKAAIAELDNKVATLGNTLKANAEAFENEIKGMIDTFENDEGNNG